MPTMQTPKIRVRRTIGPADVLGHDLDVDQIVREALASGDPRRMAEALAMRNEMLNPAMTDRLAATMPSAVEPLPDDPRRRQAVAQGNDAKRVLVRRSQAATLEKPKSVRLRRPPAPAGLQSAYDTGPQSLDLFGMNLTPEQRMAAEGLVEQHAQAAAKRQQVMSRPPWLDPLTPVAQSDFTGTGRYEYGGTPRKPAQVVPMQREDFTDRAWYGTGKYRGPGDMVSPADEATQARLRANAHAEAAKLAEANQHRSDTIPRMTAESSERPGNHPKIVLKPGTRGPVVQQHIRVARANMEAMQAGVPQEQLPVLPAIGGQRTAEGTAREKAAIAAAAKRQLDRRPESTPLAERQKRVVIRAQRKAGARDDRLHGPAPMNIYGTEGAPDPQALARRGYAPWAIKSIMDSWNATQNRRLKERELGAKEKENDIAEAIARAQTPNYGGTIPAKDKPVNWSDPATVTSKPDASPASVLASYDAQTLAGPAGKAIYQSMLNDFSPEAVRQLIDDVPLFGYSAKDTPKIDALRKHAGLPPLSEPVAVPLPPWYEKTMGVSRALHADDAMSALRSLFGY